VSSNVLIGCEYSGVVRDAFIAKGFNAMSCDLLPTDSPGPHYQGDVFDLLQRQRWDLIIIHPPCTALTVAGNSTYGEGKGKHIKRLESVEWTKRLWEACCWASPKVCLENPVGVLRKMGGFHKPTYIHPWQFGHTEQKKTCLWLHGLQPLKPTNIVYDEMMKLPKRERQRVFHMAPSPDRWKLRSTTFTGVAKAMACQWSPINKEGK